MSTGEEQSDKPDNPNNRATRSAAQIRASRRNGARSTGPKTAAGKEASRANSLRHGLLARRILPVGSDPEEREASECFLREEYQPTTRTELNLVETMARDWVLLSRVAEYVAYLTAPPAPAAQPAFATEPPVPKKAKTVRSAKGPGGKTQFEFSDSQEDPSAEVREEEPEAERRVREAEVAVRVMAALKEGKPLTLEAPDKKYIDRLLHNTVETLHKHHTAGLRRDAKNPPDVVSDHELYRNIEPNALVRTDIHEVLRDPRKVEGSVLERWLSLLERARQWATEAAGLAGGLNRRAKIIDQFGRSMETLVRVQGYEDKLRRNIAKSVAMLLQLRQIRHEDGRLGSPGPEKVQARLTLPPESSGK